MKKQGLAIDVSLHSTKERLKIRGWESNPLVKGAKREQREADRNTMMMFEIWIKHRPSETYDLKCFFGHAYHACLSNSVARAEFYQHFQLPVFSKTVSFSLFFFLLFIFYFFKFFILMFGALLCGQRRQSFM